MSSLGKKIKKKLRKIWNANIFGCFCADHKSENSSGNMLLENVPTANEKLQLIMMKSLQRQAENEEFQSQMRDTLIYLTCMLEHFFKATSSETQSDPCTPIEKGSKFTITLSKSNFSECQPNVRSNSLVLVQDNEASSSLLTTSRSAGLLASETFQNGAFGSKSLFRNMSSDKATQYHPSSPSLTSSKLIQTRFISLSIFDVKGFKLNLIKHIRTLKQDVVTLRELLSCVEYYQNGSNFERRSLGLLGVSNSYFSREEEFEGKFIQAKARASNFVRFYKLRKLNDAKKSSSYKRIKRIF